MMQNELYKAVRSVLVAPELRDSVLALVQRIVALNVKKARIHVRTYMYMYAQCRAQCTPPLRLAVCECPPTLSSPTSSQCCSSSASRSSCPRLVCSKYLIIICLCGEIVLMPYLRNCGVDMHGSWCDCSSYFRRHMSQFVAL